MKLNEFVTVDKYSRLKSDKTKETFEELVERSRSHQLEKIDSLYPQLIMGNKEFMGQFNFAWEMVKNKEILPSMRHLQFAGLPAKLNEASIYNCSFHHIKEITAFRETMFLLLLGVGVGYSIQFHHVDQLPSIKKPSCQSKYNVSDDKEGWANAVHKLMKAYLLGETLPVFDYSYIRPAGSLLKTTGGLAPGPEPLRKCLEAIEVILKSKEVGSKLKPIECHDILCHIADAVVAAGTRRSAMISLFSYWDIDMRNCKSGEWWIKNGQRSRSNNSVVLLRDNNLKEKIKSIWDKKYRKLNKKTFDSIFQSCKDSFAGEPGFFITNDLELGTNPCAEITLRHKQFCNLATINGLAIKSEEDANTKAYYAAFLASCQSLYTNFAYLTPEWKKVTEEDRLIGVSVTGIVGINTSINKREMAKAIISANNYVASVLGINVAARGATVKPEGTSSCLLSVINEKGEEIACSSGIHSYHSPYYIRRARLSINNPIVNYLMEKVPELIEKDEVDKSSYVVSFPIKAPESAITRDKETALQILSRVYDWSINYIRPAHRYGKNYNNVSCTINVRDDEWESVRDSMWINRNYWTAISLLPYNGGTYKQAPFEEITEEEYNRLMVYVMFQPNINFNQVNFDQDITNFDLACSGGICEIPQGLGYDHITEKEDK